MSYILDALRKSEQQRMQGEAPLLAATQTTTVIKKQPATLLYGLIAAILICAGMLIGWLRPWQHDEKLPEIAPAPQSAPQVLSSEPEKVSKPALMPPAQKSTPSIKPAIAADNLEQAAPAPAEFAVQPRKLPPNSNQAKTPEQPVAEAALPAPEKMMPPAPEPDNANAASETDHEQKIVAITELPLAIQQELPAMSISGFAYSSVSKERSVGINDKLLQEGEYLASGLRLEQINADSLVFSYKKYLFRHSL